MASIISALLLVAPAADVLAEDAGWAITGSAVVTYQETDASQVRNESAGSADLFLERSKAAGSWLAHIEASSTPRANGVSGILPEANADVGSALDEDNEGRLQFSELYYSHAISEKHRISAGLLDVSGFFEQSRIASDETTQFLGAFFVGNPTIEFPDYTLGVVNETGLSNGVVLRAALASSNGLADNPNRAYSQLLTVEDGEGVFGIASASWRKNAWLLRAGAWMNTADHQTLDGTSDDELNYGAYVLAGYGWHQHAANIRLGLANPDVSQGAAFVSAAYRYQVGPCTVGVGMGRSFASSQAPAPGLEDTEQYEVFFRYTLRMGLFVTADVQHIVNSNYGMSLAGESRGATIYGARLTWLYE